MVKSLTCESVGIRGISRVLGIAANTVLEKIRTGVLEVSLAWLESFLACQWRNTISWC